MVGGVSMFKHWIFWGRKEVIQGGHSLEGNLSYRPMGIQIPIVGILMWTSSSPHSTYLTSRRHNNLQNPLSTGHCNLAIFSPLKESHFTNDNQQSISQPIHTPTTSATDYLAWQRRNSLPKGNCCSRQLKLFRLCFIQTTIEPWMNLESIDSVWHLEGGWDGHTDSSRSLQWDASQWSWATTPCIHGNNTSSIGPDSPSSFENLRFPSSLKSFPPSLIMRWILHPPPPPPQHSLSTNQTHPLNCFSWRNWNGEGRLQEGVCCMVPEGLPSLDSVLRIWPSWSSPCNERGRLQNSCGANRKRRGYYFLKDVYIVT